MKSEDIVEAHLREGALHSSGAFQVDWANASRLLGKPGQLSRPVLLFIQGLVALTAAGRRPCPGARLELSYTDHRLTLKLWGSPHQPDWQKLEGDLARLALTETPRPLGLLASALLALEQQAPAALSFSGRQGKVVRVGPAPLAREDSLTLLLELSPQAESLQKTLKYSDWSPGLDHCPLPVLIQGQELAGDFGWATEDLVEVLALARQDEAAIGGRLFGGPAQHLGPFLSSWERPLQNEPPPLVRAVLESPEVDAPSDQHLPRIRACWRFWPDAGRFRRQSHCTVFPVRFGVRLNRPLVLELAAGEPPCELVVPVDDLPCDLNGELLDNQEVRAWSAQLETLLQELRRQLVERLEQTQPGSDDRPSPKSGPLASLTSALRKLRPQAVGGAQSHRQSRLFQLFREGIVQSYRQPQPLALPAWEFPLLLVGLLQEVGGRRLYTCRSDQFEHAGRLCLLLEGARAGQQHLPEELLLPLLKFRPASLMALSVADLDGEGHPTSHRELLGSSRFPPLSRSDWEPSGAFAHVGKLYLPALLVQIEAYWVNPDEHHSKDYEIRLPRSSSNPQKEPFWSEPWEQEAVRRGVSREQIQQALDTAQRKGRRRLDCLVESTGWSEPEFLRALAAVHGWPFLESLPECSTETAHLVPEHMMVRLQMVPLHAEGSELHVAMADPLDVAALDDVRLITGFQQVTVALAPAEVVQNEVERICGGDSQANLDEPLNHRGARDLLKQLLQGQTRQFVA